MEKDNTGVTYYTLSSIAQKKLSGICILFKKFTGKPYEDESHESLEIKVLGPGCARCDGLERELIEVMTEMNLSADVQHVRDVKEIGKYGVMGTPALLINGEIKSVGRVPRKNELVQWLGKAQKK